MKIQNYILILICFFPFIAYGQNNLQQAFDDCQLQGSITVYDYNNDQWTFSDKEDAKKETLPASTFKIINSLIALETGVIEDENVVFEWDGVERSIDVWNANTDLKNAFKNSTVWYYVALAEKIGKHRYAAYLKKCGYGNDKINSGKGADFWNYGDFGVTPVNQIKFLKNLYEEKLPFSKRTYDIVKRIMIVETTDDYVIRAKTGWTQYSGQDTGWWVGYLEKENDVYFFATRVQKNLETPNKKFSECRKTITKSVLKKLNIIP